VLRGEKLEGMSVNCVQCMVPCVMDGWLRDGRFESDG